MLNSEWQSPYDDNIPFDFTLDSQDARTLEAVAYLLTLPEFQNGYRKSHFKYLQLIVENLAFAHKHGDKHRISYPRGRDFYSKNKFRRDKRKNPKGIGRGGLLFYIDLLSEHGFIQNQNGFHDPVNPKNSFLSRMQPAKRLIDELIVPFRLHEVRFNIKNKHSPIEVKDKDDCLTRKHDKIPAFLEMASRVKAYNKCYDDIEIAFNDSRYGHTIPEGKNLYRVFNEDSLEKGGRFYGAWWIGKSEDERKSILINGKPTIELDFSGNHIGLLYGMAGYPMPDSLREDPYAVYPDMPHLRPVVKRCVLRAINTQSPALAWRSVNKALYEQGASEMPFKAYEATMDGFFAAHPTIKNLFFQPALSLTLQYLDSIVTDTVLQGMIMAKGKPVLPIHDSFIVLKEDKEDLLAIMKSAYLNSNDRVIRNGLTSIKDKEEGTIHL